jgi:hypothetical protein
MCRRRTKARGGARKIGGSCLRSSTGKWRSVPFLRASSAYVAVIPAEEVDAPGLAYTIFVREAAQESDRTSSGRRPLEAPSRARTSRDVTPQP